MPRETGVAAVTGARCQAGTIWRIRIGAGSGGKSLDLLWNGAESLCRTGHPEMRTAKDLLGDTVTSPVIGICCVG